MKPLFLLVLLSTLSVMQMVLARTIEIEVHGMTCAFCVDALERKLGEIKSISRVEVSLKLKKIRLQTEENMPSIKTLEQAVLDAGFTPVKITVQADEQAPK